jgi:electron transport complex protein RnfG
MKEMIRYGLILSLICVTASASLATVNALTKDKIIAQAKKEEAASLKEVFPEGSRFEEIKSGDELLYYKAYNKEGGWIGVAFKASGKGYSSTVETMAGMAKNGTITAIKVVNQSETPGLGMRITEPSFTGQFSNRGIQDIPSVQAITGATISSKAVMDSVQKKAQEIKGLIENAE